MNQSIDTETINSVLSYAWGMSLNSCGNKLVVADYNKNQLVEFSILDSSYLSFTRSTQLFMF